MRVAGGGKAVLTVEYDGTGYRGFQWQPKLPTVQAELESALRKLTGERRRVAAASRTDTGVHAKGQVACVRTEKGLPEAALVSGLNHYLPADIAVKAASYVPEGFNVRRDALSREYSYTLLVSETRSPLAGRFCHVLGGGLDVVSMNLACRLLLGEHDLASFASDLDEEKAGSTVRTVLAARVVESNGLVVFSIAASGFLRHQVRNTVGVLIRIGLGRQEPGVISDLLTARQVGLAQPAAPACGLCLEKINYPGLPGGVI